MASKKHADLIKAWLDGATIQWLAAEDWTDVDEPAFAPHTRYRIKPKEKVKKLAPFNESDWAGLIGKAVKRKNSNRVFILVGFTEEYVYLGSTAIRYQILKSDYEFIDGSPCGKYIEE